MPHEGRWKNHEEWEAEGSPRIQPKQIPPYLPEYAGIVARMLAAGHTHNEIFQVLGITRHGFNVWKANNPDLKQAWLHAKEQIRADLVRSGIEQAKGYTVVDEEITTDGVIGEDGVPKLTVGVPVRVKRVKKHVQGNSAVLKFILGGLDRQLGGNTWQEFRTVENVERHTIDAGEVLQQIDRLSGTKLAQLPEATEAVFEDTRLSKDGDAGTPVPSDSEGA